MFNYIKSFFILLSLSVNIQVIGKDEVIQKKDDTDKVQSDETSSLAKAAQNPIADMISLPFQNNLSLNAAKQHRAQNILNIQPVIPFRITKDWNIVTRTILPVISQPVKNPTSHRRSGISDTQLSLFLSPADSGDFVWGVGPIIQMPTDSDRVLGTRRWAIGPTGVALIIEGPWLGGLLINNLWDFAKVGGSKSSSINQFLAQPFINYNFVSSQGTYLVSSPIITANWKVTSRDRWVLPVGMGIGQIFKIGHQPINASLHGYYNVLRPRQTSNWQIRLQIQFLFPK